MAEAALLLIIAFAHVIPPEFGGVVFIAIVATFLILLFSYEPTHWPMKSGAQERL